MDYSGVKRVFPVFVHKKKGRMKAIRGKNGRGDDTMDGSSIEKKEEDRLFAFSWKQGRWVSDMDGGKG